MAVWMKEKVPKSGVWWVFRKSRTADGRIIRRSKRCKSKKAAEALAEKLGAIETALKLGLPAPQAPPEAEPKKPEPPKGPTFAEFADGYLKRVKPDAGRPDAGLKQATYDDYEGCLNSRLKPLLDGKRLIEIVPRDIRAVKAALEKDVNRQGKHRGQRLSRRNVEKHLRVLSSVLSEAVEDEVIASNPVMGLAKRKRRTSRERHADQRRRVDPPSEGDLNALLKVAHTHAIKRGGETVYPFRRHVPFLLTLGDAGVRLGEAVAIKWGDIDWRGHYIHIQRAYVRETIDVPKGGRDRKVYMTTRLKEALWQRYQAERRARFGNVAVIDAEKQAAAEAERDAAMMDAWVFTGEGGGLIDVSNLRRRFWHRVLTLAGLKRYRLHDLRHCYASRLLARNANPKFIQQQLGHASLQMTLDVYSHLLPGTHEGLVTILDQPAAVTQVTQGSPTTPEPASDTASNDGAQKEKALAVQGL